MIETDLDWMNKYRNQSNYIPGQKEIEFFWPLTEQIPLNLDYTGCGVKSLDPVLNPGETLMRVSGGTCTTWTAANRIETSQLVVTKDGIETPEITFTLNEKPGIIRRLAYKLLGIKWKTK